jgi:signal transduction histidine kinase
MTSPTAPLQVRTQAERPAARLPSSDEAPVPRPAALAWVIVLFSALLLVTVLIAATPALRFNVLWPRARLPIESVGVVVAALVCVLALLRFSLDARRSFLFLGLAFFLLAVNHLVFGVLIAPGSFGVASTDQMYFWISGRLLAGLLLLASAVVARRGSRPSEWPWRDVAVGAVIALGVLASVQTVLWSFRSSLPALASVSPSAAAARGILPGLTAVDLALGAAGTVLYLSIAVNHLRSTRDPHALSPWLASAFVVAAFSHVHYMLFPTVFSNYISTGDLLRLAFVSLLLTSLIVDVRRAFVSERERVRDLERAYESERLRAVEIERLDRVRADLFSMVAHDLMHPVATLRGLALILQRRWDDLDDQTRLEFCRRIEEEAGRLRDLAETGLGVQELEIEGLPLELCTVSAANLIREGAEAFGKRERCLLVQVDPSAEHATVEVDRPRIVQVVRNLLDNARKYSPADSPIELRVRATAAEVVFAVADRGPGIPPGDLPRLFSRFSRVGPAERRQVAGSGLGLYLSRLIVEEHGGKIWVDSVLDEGSTFLFALPRSDCL